MAKETKKLVQAITSQEENFAQWYTDICLKAELVEYSSMKGFIILRPYGQAIWENIQKNLDARFKATGHENVAMPVLIPESLLRKEGELVEGFAPEAAWVTMGGSEELEERLAAGDYTIALAPVTCTDGSVYTLLRRFGPDGLTGYDDPVYETLLAQAAAAGSSEVRCQLLAQAERQLLAGCAAVPLFAQHKRLLLAGGVEGLVFDPYGPVLDLTWTTKQ